MSEAEVITSAIYIDFDNVRISLERQDPELANLFVEQASAWLKCLETPKGDGVRRNFLIRRCYMNSNTGNYYADSMRRGGFQVVVCPSLTQRGKSAADMRMVLDAYKSSLDGEGGQVPIQEFIIFSSDADFMPLVEELRGRNKQTAILQLGAVATAYKNMADRTIDDLPYILEQLSGRGVSTLPVGSSAPSVESSALPVESPAPPEEVSPPLPPVDEQTQRDCAGLVKGCVRNSTQGEVSLEELDTELQTYFEDLQMDLPWRGRPGFRSFLQDLDLGALYLGETSVSSTPVPAPHAAAVPAQEDKEDPVYALAERVHEMTGAPLLSPEDYTLLFTSLAEELNVHGQPTQLTELAERVHLAGEVDSRDALFVLRGLMLAGYHFRPGQETMQALAAAFLGSVLYRCRTRANFHPDAAQQAMLQQWLNVEAGSRPGHMEARVDPVRSRCIELVRQTVGATPGGVELSRLGLLIQKEFPGLYRRDQVQTKWGGQPTLTKMLLSFNLKPLVIAPIERTLSMVYDPHSLDGDVVRDTAAKLFQNVGTPLLSMEVYGRLFRTLDDLVRHYERTPSVEALAESLAVEFRAADIGRDVIDYVMNALTESGYYFQEGKGSAASLSRYYATWVLKQCREGALSPSNQDLVRVYHWLTIGVFASPAESEAVAGAPRYHAERSSVGPAAAAYGRHGEHQGG